MKTFKEYAEELDVPNKEDSIGKKRHHMPQITKYADFEMDLFNNFIDLIWRPRLDPKELIPTQDNFNEEKVDKIIADGNFEDMKPIIISKDQYVVDGHHRWLAAHKAGRKIQAQEIDMNIEDVLEFLKGKPYIEKKTISEGMIYGELTEAFVNLLPKDEEKKRKYVDEVWDILQKSYAPIGGIGGSGFKDKEDMIKNIPFWKIGVKNDQVQAVAMYKDKEGRKRVALGALKTPEAKTLVTGMVVDGLKTGREWGEVSGPSWGFAKKTVPLEILKSVVIPIKEVQKLLPDDGVTPAYGVDTEIKSDDPFKDFYYQRNINGHLHTKIALGSPGKRIT